VTNQGTRPQRRRRGRPAGASTDETVAAVLAAARRCFAAHGYAGTSNRTVAAAAGLSHTAIYNHFGSKARLFTAVFLDVQDQLIAELDRSAHDRGAGSALPQALLAAIESLRAEDPSIVEFLASMYVEVRRHVELQDVFRNGASTFPIVERLRHLAGNAATHGAAHDSTDDGELWFWIAFALGLAQLSTVADEDTFVATVAAFRRNVDSGPTTNLDRRAL
jgi:AcrR family transcriptional regulator